MGKWGFFLFSPIFLAITGCAQNGQDILAKALIDQEKNKNNKTTPVGSPSPLPTVPQTGSGQGAVFFKNPSYGSTTPRGYQITENSNGTYNISPPTAMNYDGFLTAVTISGTQNGFLQNPDIKILTDYLTNTGFSQSTVKRAQANSQGNWFFSSVNDPDHRLGQLMAYYWIDKLKNVVNGLLSNAWHAVQKNVSVYSRCYDANGSLSRSQGLGLNAFWAGKDFNFVCMSFLDPFEAAFDASVYDHEMGHANIDYATNGQITQGNYAVSCFSSQAQCCANSNGCAGAINEGQADVHSYIVFDSGIVGDYFLNNKDGLSGRNAEKNQNLTTQAAFNNSPEIHNMGGVWGAAWWTLRKSIDQTIADKIFVSHLELLTGNDNFKTALSAIIVANNQLAQSQNIPRSYENEIRSAFAQHGITP